jgi:hypothetical protein
MTNPPFELFDRNPKWSEWPYGAKVLGYPDWVMHNHWTDWVETSGIVVTCVGTSFYFRSVEDRMQFVLAWS